MHRVVVIMKHLAFPLPELVRLAAACHDDPRVASVAAVVIAERAHLQTA